MNNYIDMNDVEQLIIDKLTGQIGDEEETRLEQLIARHHEVEQLWQQMQQVYAMRKAVSFDNSFNADAAWLSLQQKVNIPDTPPQAVPDTVAIQPKQRSMRWVRYAIAAVVVGIVFGSLYIYTDIFNNGGAAAKNVQLKLANGQLVQTSPKDQAGALLNKLRGPGIDPRGWNTLTVPNGKSYSFQLADGSQVWLNAASELKFPLSFTGLYRNVELNGEGYFKVAPKSGQPFIVSVNGLRVRALGTEFNIKSYVKENSCIALVTGSVSVQNVHGEEIILNPGEAAIADANSHLVRKQPFDSFTVLAWMKGLYSFNDEKLRDIIVIAERWFDVPVQLQEPGMANLRFTGELNRNKPVNNFFDLLASTGYIRYEWKNGKVLLSRH